jgi:hypothetical protein
MREKRENEIRNVEDKSKARREKKNNPLVHTLIHRYFSCRRVHLVIPLRIRISYCKPSSNTRKVNKRIREPSARLSKQSKTKSNPYSASSLKASLSLAYTHTFINVPNIAEPPNIASCSLITHLSHPYVSPYVSSCLGRMTRLGKHIVFGPGMRES